MPNYCRCPGEVGSKSISSSGRVLTADIGSHVDAFLELVADESAGCYEWKNCIPLYIIGFVCL